MKWELFWKKVDERGPDECWPWLGAVTKDGHGRYHVRSYRGVKKERTLKAYRIVWEIANGPVPDGKSVCHSCHNPLCCNPKHLYLGDPLDNWNDQLANGTKTRNLTEDQVREIRSSKESTNALARKFGVDKGSVSMARRGLSYKWVTSTPEKKTEVSSSSAAPGSPS